MKLEVELATVGRISATLVAVAAAVLVGQRLWVHYRVEPWTRDGRVRADVVQVASDVSGLVTTVLVKDNQSVKAGDVLFVLDRPRFELAREQASANVAAIRVQIAQAKREDSRNLDLGDLVSGEIKEQSRSRLDQLAASLLQAMAMLKTAELNLTRTEVRASVRGLVTNLDLRPGSYASAGKPALAIVDQDSLYVVGYFEETKIARVEVGDIAEVRLMGETEVIRGHVDSIAAGIEDRERSPTTGLLANVNPTFNWVRLSQRIPVRVHLDVVPSGLKLVMGRTATVDIVGQGRASADGKRS